MNYQQAVVDQIVQNLAFEVEAVPKNKSVRSTSVSQSTPLNVKIKVRKKDEILNQHDVSTIPDDAEVTAHKVRLVNSDRTIMNFDVFMEAEFKKKPSRKLHKQVFDKLRPGICLGAADDDEYVYMPSSSYSANITEPAVATRSDGTLKQTFTLSKNTYQSYPVSNEPVHKWLFGKCKPGGCLDPPFSEDKYSYKPSTRSGPESIEPNSASKLEESKIKYDDDCDISSDQKPTKVHDEDVKTENKRSSFFDGGLFKKKTKSKDEATNTKSFDKTDSTSNLYHVESPTNSLNADSNSIITYPPKISSDIRISDDKTNRSKGPCDDKPKKSFNDHSEPYFIPPKGINRIKEKDTLNQKDYTKRKSPDVSESKVNGNESLKMPIPIPVPVPIPVISNKVETKGDNTKTYDILPKQDENAEDEIVTPDEELQEKSSLRSESVKGETENQPLILKNEDLSDVQQPVVSLSDSNLSDIKPGQNEKKDNENNIKYTVKLNKETETEPFIMPIPVPIVVKQNADSGTSLTEINSSENSMKTDVPPQSHEKTDTITNKYLRATNNSTDEEMSQSETLITTVPTMKGDTESDSNIEQINEQIIKPDDEDPSDIKSEDNISILPSFEEEEDNINQPYEDPNAITIDPKEAGSKTQSVTDENFHNVEIPDTDIVSDKEDEIEKPTLSKAENETTTVFNEILQSPLREIPEFPRTDRNYITAPILVEKIEPITNSGQIKVVISKTSLLDKPITDDSEQSKEIVKDQVAMPSASDKLIGPESVVHDFENIPPAISEKNTERNPSFDKHVHIDTGMGGLEIMQKPSKTSDEAATVSSTASTNTLKSVLKKDALSVELGFHSYLNDKNVRILRTFDTAAAPTRFPNDSITVIKSQIRISSHEIRIPVDSDHDFSIQIKKANTNQHVSISDSGFVTVDSDRSAKQRSPTQGYTRSAHPEEQQKVQTDVPDNSVIDLYEQELIPLQTIIKNLRDEIDVLAAQQTTFKDKMFCPNKSKLPRLVHSHKKCIGCVRK